MWIEKTPYEIEQDKAQLSWFPYANSTPPSLRYGRASTKRFGNLPASAQPKPGRQAQRLPEKSGQAIPVDIVSNGKGQKTIIAQNNVSLI